MQPTKQGQVTCIDAAEAGRIVAIAAVSVPHCDRDPAPATPDPLPLWLLGAVVSLGLLALGAIALPGLVSGRVQALQSQNQAQQAELSRIKQCVNQ